MPSISVWGPGRVGMHLAPRGDIHSIGDSNLAATFGHVATEAGRRQIAFLMARESLGENRLGPGSSRRSAASYIANEKFTKATAEQVLEAGEADAVAFGVLFIANPDLPRRFALDCPAQ